MFIVKPWMFGCLVMLAVAYEVAALYQRKGSTISEIVWGAHQYPILPFMLGVLCGHFFWQAVRSVGGGE